MFATAICSSSGRYGTSSMIRVNVCWTLRISAVSSGPSSTSSGSSETLRDEVGLLADPLVDPHALAGLDQDPQAAVRDLEHARDDARDADRVQLVRPRRLEVGVLGAEHDEHPVAGQDVVDELDRALLADRQRRQRVRVGDRVAQRQDRELVGEAFGDLALDGAHRSVPRIWTVRGRAGRSSGSSTVRIPSSYVASAASASTSAPSATTRRNGPRSISSCW